MITRVIQIYRFQFILTLIMRFLSSYVIVAIKSLKIRVTQASQILYIRYEIDRKLDFLKAGIWNFNYLNFSFFLCPGKVASPQSRARERERECEWESEKCRWESGRKCERGGESSWTVGKLELVGKATKIFAQVVKRKKSVLLAKIAKVWKNLN